MTEAKLCDAADVAMSVILINTRDDVQSKLRTLNFEIEGK